MYLKSEMHPVSISELTSLLPKGKGGNKIMKVGTKIKDAGEQKHPS